MNYSIAYKKFQITLDKNRLEDIKKNFKHAVQKAETGKRTTSHGITSNAYIIS